MLPTRQTNIYETFRGHPLYDHYAALAGIDQTTRLGAILTSIDGALQQDQYQANEATRDRQVGVISERTEANTQALVNLSNDVRNLSQRVDELVEHIPGIERSLEASDVEALVPYEDPDQQVRLNLYEMFRNWLFEVMRQRQELRLYQEEARFLTERVNELDLTLGSQEIEQEVDLAVIATASAGVRAIQSENQQEEDTIRQIQITPLQLEDTQERVDTIIRITSEGDAVRRAAEEELHERYPIEIHEDLSRIEAENNQLRATMESVESGVQRISDNVYAAEDLQRVISLNQDRIQAQLDQGCSISFNDLAWMFATTAVAAGVVTFITACVANAPSETVPMAPVNSTASSGNSNSDFYKLLFGLWNTPKALVELVRNNPAFRDFVKDYMEWWASIVGEDFKDLFFEVFGIKWKETRS